MRLFDTLLRLGIISSLSDREAFIKKTAELIQRYYDDPDAAERLAKIVATYLDDMKSNLNMKRIVGSSLDKSDFATKDDIEKINKMLKDLMAEVRKQRAAQPDDGSF